MQPTGTFLSDGIELTYFEQYPAENAPKRNHPIILVHGFASNSHMNWIMPGWFKTLTQAGYHTISFDNRGHGMSEKSHDLEIYGAPLMAADVRALCQHLKLNQVHLMGYSMGARISVFVTKLYPEILASVIVAGMGYNLVRGMGNPEPIARALEAPTAEDVTNPAAKSFRTFAEQTQSDLKSLAACIRSTRAPVELETLANIKIPALVAVGTTDVIAGSGEKLTELIPNAAYLPIKGRDHMRAVGDAAYKAGVLSFLENCD